MTKPPRPFVFRSEVPPARDDRSDQELLRDLASGRRQALGELYDRHSTSLFRHALALTRRSSDAEDLVQAVFVKLATTGAQLLGVRKPASYLHRILNTTWVDTQRRTIAGERAVESGATDSPGPRPAAFEDSIDLTRALDTLPPNQREVIVLHLVDGFSFREIGLQTGVSLFTAAARYRLAVSRLRQRLGRPLSESGETT